MSVLASPTTEFGAVRRSRVRQALLSFGLLSSLLYIVATDVVAAGRWEGYNRTSRMVSDLFAVGAPSRQALVPLFAVYTVLVTGFGIGIWISAEKNRALRATGALLIGFGLANALGSFFPLNLGSDDAVPMHIVATVGLIVFMMAAVIASAWAFGRGFFIYAFATIGTMLVSSTMSFVDVAEDPTPFLGITERISIGSFLLWAAVLSIILIRNPVPPRQGV